MRNEIIEGYKQAFKELGEIGDKRKMKSIDELLEEWHKTKNIGVARDICDRLWRLGHEEDEDGE